MILGIWDGLLCEISNFEVRWHGALILPLAPVLLMIVRISTANAERTATQDAQRGDRAGLFLGGGQRAQLHAVRRFPGDCDARGRGRRGAARAGPSRSAAD